jgi:hypothetical protein
MYFSSYIRRRHKSSRVLVYSLFPLFANTILRKIKRLRFGSDLPKSKLKFYNSLRLYRPLCTTMPKGLSTFFLLLLLLGVEIF